MLTLTIPETAAALSPETAPGPEGLESAAIGLAGDAMACRWIETVLGESSAEVVASARTIHDLLDRERLPIQAAVLIGGGETVARGGPVDALRKLRPACAIVLVVKGDERPIIKRALRAGVGGLVHEKDVEQALAATIAAVLAGQITVPQSIRYRVAWDTFSTREKQVLQLAANGLTNGEIAERLFLSESTVKSHLSSSFRKLGVSSRSEAAAVVFDSENGMDGSPSPTPEKPLEHHLLGAPA